MKKTFMVSLFALVTMVIYSCGSATTETTKKDSVAITQVQTEVEELSIAHQHDEIEGKDYYGVSKPLNLVDGKEGFSINIFFKKQKDKVVYSGFAINASRVGACHENSVLYVLFQDGTKTQLKQWNDFNCDGDVYLDLYHTELKKLNKPIKGMKLVNGRDYTSYEKMFTEESDMNYFINVLKLIEKQNIVEVKEMPTY